MMPKNIGSRIAHLESRRSEVSARIAEIDEELPGLILDDKAAAAQRLRSERRNLSEEFAEIEAAISAGRERLDRDEETAALKQCKADQTAASKAESACVKSAVRVDGALKDLEAAWLDYEARCVDADEAARQVSPPSSRRSHDVAIRRSRLLRAFWSLAPKLSSSVGIAFCSGRKRHGLSEG